MGLCQIYVHCSINGSIISRKSKNLSKNAMSEVHFSTKNLPPFASNYRSTANTYNFTNASQVHFRTTVKPGAKIINCLELRPLLDSPPEVVWLTGDI